MKERPITPTADAIRELMAAGTAFTWIKVVEPQPKHRLVEGLAHVTIGMNPADDGDVWYDADCINPGREVRCPIGRVGDGLWVRERCSAATWDDGLNGVYYFADKAFLSIRNTQEAAHRWSDLYAYRGSVGAPVPASRMPAWAARIRDTITAIRPVRAEEDGVDHWGKAYRAGEWVWRVEVTKQ